jgi:hypothetical protein
MSDIKPFRPIYCSGKNKLLKYRYEPFDDGHGHTAILRIAEYIDKNNNQQEMVAQVKWDHQ